MLFFRNDTYIPTPLFTVSLVVLFVSIYRNDVRAILVVVVDVVAWAVRRHGGHRFVCSLLPLLSPFLQPQ